MMTLRRDDPPEISSTKTIPAETIPAKTTPAKTTPAGGVPTARVRPLVVTRGILWSFRLLHLAPLVALFLLPVGKWPAVIIAALWPLWLIGLFFLEMQLLHRWLGLGLSRAGRAFLRDAEAADYYHHAAARGHPRAQGRLGEMYRTGNAVPRNRVAAHMWLSRALAGMAAAADGADWPAPGRARRGEDSEREEMLADYHAFAAALAALEKAMTPAQISKAQARVSGGANKGGK